MPWGKFSSVKTLYDISDDIYTNHWRSFSRKHQQYQLHVLCLHLQQLVLKHCLWSKLCLWWWLWCYFRVIRYTAELLRKWKHWKYQNKRCQKIRIVVNWDSSYQFDSFQRTRFWSLLYCSTMNCDPWCPSLFSSLTHIHSLSILCGFKAIQPSSFICCLHACSQINISLNTLGGYVVQSWVSGNPGLSLNHRSSVWRNLNSGLTQLWTTDLLDQQWQWNKKHNLWCICNLLAMYKWSVYRTLCHDVF